MTTIAQRELRNHVSAVIRRAEEGERFTITVGGRPVAELGPLSNRRRPSGWAAVLAETPVDPGWEVDLRRLREEDAVAGLPLVRTALLE